MESLVLESIEEHGTEWGISITDPNPTPEHYFKMPDKETAFRVQELLTKLTPISLNYPIGIPLDEI
jgi:hypothetical protein